MNDLQKLEKRMKALEDTVERLNVDLAKNAKATQRAGKAAATASGNIQRMGIAFRTTLAPITAIVGGLTLITKALNTTGDRAANFAVIESGLVGLVDNSSAAADALLDMADNLGKATLFDEEDFTEIFKLFTSFRSIGVDSYERVAAAAADMGTKLGTAPQAAALQLAKALEDPAKQVTALARSGTVFTEQQKEQIKTMQESGDLLGAQNMILSEIEKQYGGAAEAAGAAGFAGALDSAGEAWRDFLEVLGQSSESGAIQFLNGIADGLNFIVANFDVVGPAAEALLGVITEPFKALYEGIQQVTGPVDNFREQFRGTIAIITKLVTDITNNVLAPVFRFIGKIIGGVLKLLAGLVVGIVKAAKSAVEAVTGALDIIAKAVAAFINSTPAGILSKLFGIDAGALAANGIRNFAAGIDNLAASVGDYAEELRAAGAAAQAAAPEGGGAGGNPFAGAGPRGNAGGGKKGGGAKGGGGGKGGAAKAAADAAKLQEAIDKQVLAAEKLVTAQQRRNELMQVTDVNQKAMLESENRLYEIAEKYGALAEKSLSDKERELLLKAQGLEVENERLALEEKLEQIREGAIGSLDEEIKKLEYKLAGKEEEYKWEKMIADAKARGGDPAEVEAKVNRLRTLTEESAKVDELKSAYEGLARGIAGEMTNAFRSMIDGSKSAEEAMGDMLKNIGDMFIDEAMRILQDQIVQQLLKLIPALFGGGVPAAGPGPGSGAFDIGRASFEGGGYTGGGPRSGGLDGKGGYMAMVHPDETIIDHRAPMGRYNGGNSPSNGGAMTINFQTQMINSVEYVTKEQAMAMSQQAADDGAKRGASGGHARSMQTLLNSRSQRAKLGMS